MAWDFDKAIAAYLATPDVKKQMKAHVAKERQRSGGTGGVGDEGTVRAYANEAIAAIIASLPISLRASPNHAISTNDLHIVKIAVNQDGDYEVELAWNPAAIHRTSLYEDGYPEGVQDIVALLSTGYRAHAPVWGYWDGHTASSLDLRSITGTDAKHTSAWQKSLTYRAADPFLQVAVAAFNAAHTKDHVKIKLGPQYLI